MTSTSAGANTVTARSFLPADANEERRLREHLRARYDGVLDAAQIERHVADHVGFGEADAFVEQVVGDVGRDVALLDVGSGFGSFVLAARRAGIRAVGIDPCRFDVEFGERRLRDDPMAAVPGEILGSGLELPFREGSFDVVTLWNLLEHVPDEAAVVGEVQRVLRPGGLSYVVCPNYLALRREAHYQVFWPSLIPRSLGTRYLRARGRNPQFFEEEVFYRTNWGVLRALRRAGLRPHHFREARLIDPTRIERPTIRTMMLALHRLRLLGVVRLMLWIAVHNPLRRSIVLHAKKPQES